MSWLETLNPRDARHLARLLRGDAAHLQRDAMAGFDTIAERVRDVAEPTLKYAGRAIRREAPVVASAAVHQAAKLARSAKADPVPVVVGAVGLLLLANLFLGRKRP